MFVYKLALELSSRGWRVKVLAIFGVLDDVGENMLFELRESGVQVELGSTGKLEFGIFFLRQLFSRQPKIFHSNLDHSDIFSKLMWYFKTDMVLLRTLHTVKFSPSLKMFHNFLRKGFYNCGCSDIVASEYISNGINVDKVIYNGVHVGKGKSRYFNDVLEIVVVGNFNRIHGVEVKNQRYILEILSNLKVPYNCTFYGDGACRNELENVARSQKLNVTFMGNVRDVQSHLYPYHLYLSASTFEGLPFAALEAMSTGLPALLSNIPAHRELKNVRLFSLDNASRAAQKIVEFYYQNVNQKYVYKIEDKYNFDKMVSDYEKIYNILN